MKYPAFMFYPRDWICSNSVRKMTGQQVKAYMYLLCASWLEDERATIPPSDEDIAAMACVDLETWLKIKGPILEKFSVLESGRRGNERLLEESSKVEVRSKSGSKGGSKTQANRVANRVANHQAKVKPSVSYSVSVSDSTSNADSERNLLSGKPDDLRGYHKDSRSALHVLNEESGKHFREVDANLKVISARLQEPDVTLDGVRAMIARQVKRWRGTSQEEYLRPETLFGKSKFDGYYAAKEMPIAVETNQKTSNHTTQIVEGIRIKDFKI